MLNILRQWTGLYYGAELILLLVVIVVVGGMIAILGSVLAPIFASLIVAYLMHGWIVRLSRIGSPVILSASLLTLLLVCAMIFILFFMLPLVWKQVILLSTELPDMIIKLRELFRTLLERYDVTLPASQIQVWQDLLTQQLPKLSKGFVSQSVGTIIGLAQLSVYVVLLPLLVFFLLRDGSNIVNTIRSKMKPDGMLLQIWNDMNEQLANYVRGKALEIVLVGGLSYILFLSFGLRYTVLLAVLSGLSVLIPYIGAFIVTFIVTLVSFIQWGTSDYFYYLIIAYTVLQLLDGNVFVPVIFSDSVSLHPISIVLAVLVFGGLWGFWGIFFAIPLATFVKAIYIALPKGLQINN